MTGKKYGNRILIAACLIALFCLSLAFSLPAAPAATATTEYSVSDNVFIIDSQADFAAFSALFDKINRNFYGKKIILHCDVDIAATPFSLSTFAGTLDGCGHKILGATQPLFSRVTSDGTVQNVCFEDAALIGSLFVNNEGTLENLAFSGTITTRPATGSATFLPAAIVSTNSGTVSNCVSALRHVRNVTIINNVYGGFASENTGTIEDCVFVGDFDLSYSTSVQYTVGGIACDNDTGTIENCVAATDMSVSVSVGSTNATLPTLFAIADGGTVTDSFAWVNFDGYSFTKTEEGTPVVYTATLSVADGTLSGVYAAFSSDNGVGYDFDYYYSDNGAMTSGLLSDLTSANLGLSYDCSGALPILNGFFAAGSGTNVDPYVLSSEADRLRLRVAQHVASFEYALDYLMDIDLFEEFPDPVAGFTTYTAGAWDDKGYYGASDYGYTPGETEVPFVAETPAGSGTREDPYLVTSAQELKYLDGKTGYALLEKDLVLNRAGDGGHRLGIEALSLVFCGNGHAIIGLNEEPLFETISATGAVKNLVLYGHGGYVADRNEGTVVFVTSKTTADCGFVGTNVGTIIDCVFDGTATYAFCEVNEGLVKRCVSTGTATTVFSPTSVGTYAYCIAYADDSAIQYTGVDITLICDETTPSYAVVINGQRENLSDLLPMTLLPFGFDFSSGEFGYEVGADTPSLRRVDRTYKTRFEDAFSEPILLQQTYSPSISYTLTDMQASIVHSDILSDTTFAWTYGGENFAGTIQNAGVYSVTATYSGDALYLPEIGIKTFTIQKADPSTSISFAENAFSDVTAPYDGEVYAPTQPAPENLSALTALGYGLSYSVAQGGVPATVKNAGTYVQTVTATSVNYVDLTTSRTVTIEKSPLYVTVGDMTCSFGEAIDWSGATAQIQSGLATADQSETLASLVGGLSGKYTTTYQTGDNVGTYSVGLTATAQNYVLSVTPGTLTVNPIDLPLDGISFADDTVNYDGGEKSLSATCPNGVSVSYSNNGHVNAGVYEVTATFTKPNYNQRVLTATLTVEKIVLTVDLPDGYSDYGEGWTPGDPQITGFVAGDETLASGLEFSYLLKKNDSVVSSDPTEVVDAGTYDLTASSETVLDNYVFEFLPGTYIVNKISLSALYDGADFIDVNKTYNAVAVQNAISYFADHDYTVDLSYAVQKDGAPFVGSIVNAGVYAVTATATPTGDLATNYLAAEYARTVTIEKAVSSVSFTAANYSYEYDGTDRADLQIYSFTGTVAKGDLVLTANGSSSAVHVGGYALVASYAGDENTKPCSANATLTITPRTLSMTFRQNYVFSGETIVPELLTVEGNVEGETITQEDLAFSYYASSGGSILRVLNANDYTFAVLIGDGDYVSSAERYDLRVDKKPIPVSIGSVEYLYGVRGEITLNGVVYSVNANGFSRKNYPLDNGTVDVIVNLPSSNAGLYVLTDANLVDTTNYDFSLTEGTHAVTVARRTLAVSRTYNGNAVDNPHLVSYAGQSLTGRYRYVLTNFVEGDSQDDLDLEVRIVDKSTGSAADIYHVGQYGVTLILRDSLNYDLGATQFSTTVVAVDIFISVGDVQIEQGENFISPALTVTGAVGEDVGKNYSQLKGASVSYVHSYKNSTTVNSVLTVTVDASFDDYLPTVTKTGTLTVVPNEYPDYALPEQAQFVYDGETKTVEIENVNPQWVRYGYSGSNLSGNDLPKNVGTYTVSAIVTYPSGRTRISNCRLVIVKANPIVAPDVIEAVYVEDKLLSDDMISGRVTLAGKTYVCPETDPEKTSVGTFSFISEHNLVRGQNEYECLFTPTDGNNYNAVTCTVVVHCAAVDMTIFSYDPADKFAILEMEDGHCLVRVDGSVDLTLRPVLEGLELYRNGYKVNYIRLDKAETINVTVRLKTDVVLAFRMEVTLPEIVDPVVFDDTLLDFGVISASTTSLSVPEGGGRITLAESMKNEYNLYVDGILVTDYVLNGNEGRITVSIRKKGDDKVVFARVYDVAVAAEEDPGKTVNKAMWFGIGGGVLGLAAIIAVGLIIWKKKNG